MAEGILGLGSSGSVGLNQDLIDKLKEAERKSTVEPIESDLEDIDLEEEKLQEIIAKSNELLDAIKPFDLYVSGGVSAFDQKTANTTGSSVVFDAVDASSIDEGTTNVKINQLAQKDVYQTNIFSDADEQILNGNDSGDMLILDQMQRPVYQSDLKIDSASSIIDPSGGDITITINGNDRVFNISGTTTYKDLMTAINEDTDLKATITISGRLSITSEDEETELTIVENISNTLGISRGEKFSTEGMTYAQLAEQINSNSNYNASIEGVGSNSNRLIIKSAETGLDNKISITQSGFDMGLNEIENNTVKAQNLLATVDGIDYNVSSNVLVVDGGLKITAVEVDEDGSSSTISVQNDTSTVSTLLDDFVTKYNEFMDLVNEELYSTDSSLEDKSTIRTVVESIKETLFNNYGSTDDLNIFNFGLEIDKTGYLTLDSATFNEAIENDLESVKNLFIGTAENEGLGTSLKEYLDSLDSLDGLLSSYENSIDTRRTSLEEEQEEAQEVLDNKYILLAEQFASYTAIITEYENQFSSLQLMIEQSTS